jgi:cell wall-associated NlpC family hydrolase
MNVKNSVYIVTIVAGASLLSSVKGIAQPAARPSNLRTTMAASGVTTIIGAAKAPTWPTALSTVVALRVTDPSVHTSATTSEPVSTPVLVTPAASVDEKGGAKVEGKMTAQGSETVSMPKTGVAANATTGAVKPASVYLANTATARAGGVGGSAPATPRIAATPTVVAAATPHSGSAASISLAPVATASTSPLPASPVPARQARLPQTTPVQPVTVSPAKPTTLSSRHKDMLLLEQLQNELQDSTRRLDRADAGLSEGQKQLASWGNVLSQAMLEAGPDASGLHPFVRVAHRYAGTPYVWGGESGRGFDCSGFIIRVMRDLGYQSLPHSAAEQFNYGMPIAEALLKPGDLVFFANTYKPGISHVGIYLGKRRFIHAAGTGTGTIVSSLDSPKYRAKYAGARRLNTAR